MPIIICFEGSLAADPIARTTTDGTTVTEAVVLVNPTTKTGSRRPGASPTRYIIKAWRDRGRALATLTTGAGVVIIGHVETETWIPDTSNPNDPVDLVDQPAPSSPAPKRRYRDTVVVDSIGTPLTAPRRVDTN
ncbi:single-stranded DNA-binding protein [Pimelobacter sp. 30-1]|uniref:single-stranded DNA-binding protein n=1 Tax=Pimelobacter sp. 30-1 TaxID=2004991 RepID=UPI001C03D9BE|nr:single-stranded DNA-binding protein [Pimelobacter sp. 30-1]